MNRDRHCLHLYPLLVALALIALGATWPATATAHATLVRADPPIDGLVAAPPAQLRLEFSEEVYAGEGSPSIRVLDEQGNTVETSPIGSGVVPARPREVLVEVDGLGRGTYTVVWSVRSATDGHTLEGTYAFRVGGGVPPGAATVAGDAPAAWAVALRWLTFLGAALAAGGFLFGRIILRGLESPADWSKRRTGVILAGVAVALLATLAEPVLQTLFPPAGVDGDLGEMVQALPRAWWLRPAALGPLLLLTLVLAGPLRGRTPRIAASVGLAFSLVALLGLALTSHAAGRETWRGVAVATNVLHQWSTALWVGGLVHLALWWPSRRDVPHTGTEPLPDEAAPPTLPVHRFSAIALGLLVVSVVTGSVNTGFVVPAAERFWSGLRDGEFHLPSLSVLWEDGYSAVLLVKLAVLLLPLALAAYNRVALRRGLTTLATTL
ncbi:MAG: copper resistance protein CopC, partial [Chloroflexota bacterium]|nr:copper resistance protein CopC [Chloroflexota bacterium]